MAGLWRDPVQAARDVYRAARTVVPRPDMAERYRAQHELYLQLYPALAPLHARLEQL